MRAPVPSVPSRSSGLGEVGLADATAAHHAGASAGASRPPASPPARERRLALLRRGLAALLLCALLAA